MESERAGVVRAWGTRRGRDGVLNCGPLSAHWPFLLNPRPARLAKVPKQLELS